MRFMNGAERAVGIRCFYSESLSLLYVAAGKSSSIYCKCSSRSSQTGNTDDASACDDVSEDRGLTKVWDEYLFGRRIFWLRGF